MNILITGATGATGTLLVAELLARGHHVRAITRRPQGLPKNLHAHPSLTIIPTPVLEMNDSQKAMLVKDCEAVVSCLGHTLSFRGLFGKPRRLVRDSLRAISLAVQANSPNTPPQANVPNAPPQANATTSKPIKFILMNSTGCRNRDLREKISLAQHIVIGILRACLPPHADNEDAADYLRTEIGQNHRMIEWACVRPDSLTNDNAVTPYTVHPSPTRSAIFDSGKTSRINVAHFMAELITDPTIWSTWKGKMPVLYNKHETTPPHKT